jgi:hypothetical protein
MLLHSNQIANYHSHLNKNKMQNQLVRQFSTAIVVSLGMLASLNLTAFTAPADAACRPTGRMIAGRQELRCDGGPSRCRPTGRYKIVRGVRYNMMNCR